MATVEVSDDKKKALNVAISQIEKSHGKGSIMRMGTDGPKVQVPAIPTGAINLDAAIGIGGIPRGRITEIYGPESSGKTTVCLHVIANAQRMGGMCAFIDAEHALDIEYARQAGGGRGQPPRLAARHGRAGAGDRRDAGALRRPGRGGDRLGRGAGAAGGDRGRDGRQPRRPAGAADEPGAAQADGRDQPLVHLGDLHQPDPREDRGDVRQPGDHHRRPGAEVLRLPPDGHPPDRLDQGQGRAGRATRRG